MGAGVSVTRKTVGVTLGGVRGAFEETADELALLIRQPGRLRIDLRHEGRPGIGSPRRDAGSEPHDRAAAVAWIGVSADVAGALETVDQPGRAPRGQLQQAAQLAGSELARACEMLDGEHLAVRQPEPSSEGRALARVGERFAVQR